MKILYCNKYNFRFSGTENYLFDTIDLMRARGHQAALFSMRDSRGEPTPYDQHFASPVDFKLGGFAARAQRVGRAIYSIHTRQQIRKMIEDFRPDVAHLRNIYHHLSTSILWELKAQNVPVIYHLNDMKLVCPTYNMVGASGQTCERCKGGGFWNVVAEGCYAGGRGAATVLAFEAYLHRWLKTYEKCVDLFLAPSEFVKQKLIENGWDGTQIQVLPHFQQLPAEVSPHPGPDAPVLYFGRLSPEKGVSDLVSAMAMFPKLRLLIAGDGPLRAALEKSVSDRGLGNVTFVGHIHGVDLHKLIAGSQFTIFPSHAYETLGKSILESYAQARTVVASDLGSRRELVEERKTGLLYQVGNITQLSDAIRLLCERPELTRVMGEAGREFVRQRHSPEQHLLALTEIYERLANARAGEQQIRSNTSAAVGVRPSSPSSHLRIAYIGGRGVIGKYSGIETYYEETGKRLARRGHQVTVYCRRHFTPAGRNHNGMRIVRLPTIRSKHLETLVHTLLSTIHACFSGHDVVHYQALGPSLFSFVPRLFGKKTIVTVQGLDWQRKKWSWFARSVLKKSEWSASRMPNQTVLVSNTLQERFQSKYRRQYVYIPNGTELRERKLGPHLEQLGLTSDRYILFLGRFSPEKNCDLLIDAFEQIQTPMKLVLAGGSAYPDEYTARLRSRENDRVKILQWLSGDALHEVLTNAALFVLPSDLEGLSLSLLEAMGAGICVLASDNPENREAIADCGFTFKGGDVDDLARMLGVLCDSPELREEYGQKGRLRVKAHYLWEEVVSKIEATYDELFTGPKSSRNQAAAGKSA